MDSRSLFEILAREHQRPLLAYIRSFVNDSATADDVWQETMLTAWRRLSEFDRTRPFGPWLRGIAVRIAMARNRADRRVLLVGDQESLEYLSARFEEVQSLSGDTLEEKLDALRDCIAQLTPRDQQCIELRYREELSWTDLASRMQSELEAMKKRMARAKVKLLECIQRKMSKTPSVAP